MSYQDVTKPPFRADHVGSLLRPSRLHGARRNFAGGKISSDQLRKIEDECISEVIKKQEECGLKAVTDGEFRRTLWHYDFLCGFEGVDQLASSQGPKFVGGASTAGGGSVNNIGVSSKISNQHGTMIDHFSYLYNNTTVSSKFCIPSPSLAYHRGGRALIDKDIYRDLESFWSDLCAAYRDQIIHLANAGCTYLQLDDTTFAMLCDPKVRHQMEDRGDDPAELIRIYGNAITQAISERPDNMTVTIHMCRGNARSSWLAEGGYEPVAENMFAGVPVDGFFMEWDTSRAGGFEPLRFAPRDKMIVLGLVSSKFGELENKDKLKRRIEEAAKYIPLENLCISPQCGFASTAAGNIISEDDQWRKLTFLVEVAEEIWGNI
jgi:5-methyltetrahydropteroyltriglutamate--homocysteine methyltransferase